MMKVCLPLDSRQKTWENGNLSLKYPAQPPKLHGAFEVEADYPHF